MSSPSSKPKNRRRRRGRRSSLTADLLKPTLTAVASAEGLQHDSGADPARGREDLHRLACEAGRAGSWYMPLDTGECVLSPIAAALVGLPPQEIVLPRELWRRHVDPAHLDRLKSIARAGIEEDRPFDLEFRARRPDGTEYWLYARGGVVRDSDGKPVRLHGALVDLTDHRNAKDELSRLNATLEDRVARRTAELLEAQDALRQSQKLEAMGQLTGGIAHDFNNLLTPIIAALDRLQHGTGRSAGERRLIEAAMKSADSARLLVQRLLAFARRQPLQPVQVDTAALVSGMADLIARTLGPQIRIELDLADDLRPARADANQLEMAILNLCVNARDAMPAGGTLTIAAANRDVPEGRDTLLDCGSYVRLAVTDTGTGMDAPTRERAVEPFFSTKQEGEGTGLGLSMVHGLASQLGGALTLASAPGRGTTAELWLPVWVGAVAAEAESPPSAPGPAAGIALLVDDHALVRTTTAEMLADLGFEVVEAASAEEAVRLVSSGLRPNLVVADHLMTGMTGADLARLLRGRFPQAGFLLISGHADAEDAAPELLCLTKPFRKADLETAIAAVTGGALQLESGAAA